MPKPPTPTDKPAAPAPAEKVEALVAGHFAVEIARPLPDAGGGLPAFVATDRNGGGRRLMAVQVQPGAPPRAAALAKLASLADPHILTPIAHGPAPGPGGRPTWFVICPAPPGPALWPASAQPIAPWSEGDLLARVLRPAAAALAVLQAQHITHRALRPGNVFIGAGEKNGGDAAVLGCAWASPPGMHQPAAFEPPYVAMCPPAARGEGAIADDVYALGVILLALAMGRLPLADLDPAATVQLKLELGCFKALAGEARLTPMIADLVAAMLSQDPQHRPTPAALADPAAVRARKVAARPPRRAARSLEIGAIPVWESRMLAYALAREPEQGLKLLRLGVVDHWLRRVLGDIALAGRLEEPQRQRANEAAAEDAIADARLVLRAVALIDPLAPLCWSGLAVWPDGLGPAMVAEQAGKPDAAMRAKIEEIVANEAVVAWIAARPDQGNAATLRQSARQNWTTLRQKGWAGGAPRLVYVLNPLLPCRSPVLSHWPVARLEDLLPALETAASRASARAALPIDREMAAFIAARQESRADGDLAALADAGSAAKAALLQLALLAEMQQRLKAPPLPGLAGWLAKAAAPALEEWRNRALRAERQAAIEATVPAGDLAALLAVLDDAAARGADDRGYAEATASVQRIDAEIRTLLAGAERRTEHGLRLGQEMAAVLGLAVLVACAVAAALG